MLFFLGLCFFILTFFIVTDVDVFTTKAKPSLLYIVGLILLDASLLVALLLAWSLERGYL